MDWVLQLANEHPTLGYVWLIWVTFHDVVQWAVMAFLGVTVLRQRRRMEEAVAKAVKDEIVHIHEELHVHILEDIELHGELGQDRGLSEGT